jgi:salicylate hydroxylase
VDSRHRQFSWYGNPLSLLTWYEGRSGALQDVEIAYAIKLDGSNAGIEKDPEKLRALLRDEMTEYHEDLQKAMELAPIEGVSDWDVYTLEPLETSWEGRTVLVGDAAHSMLFTSGQGGCQGLEDAAALSVLFATETLPVFAATLPPHGVDLEEVIKSRLEMFNKVRKERVQLMQRLSGTRLGKEAGFFKRYEPDLSWKGERIQTTEQHLHWMYKYDIFEDSRRTLEEEGRIRAHL